MPRKQQSADPPAKRYIWMDGMEARYNRGRKQITRWVAAKVLPPPTIVVMNRMGWEESILDEADKKNTREAGGKTEFARKRITAD
jgi:hypothetical protein